MSFDDGRAADGHLGAPAPASATVPADPPDPVGPHPQRAASDDAELDALLDRLSELEAGLRSELATQVERAEQAEVALAAAEARALSAEVAARASSASSAPSVAAPSGPPARETPAEDREALATALREVRSYLERRRRVEGELVAIAREAVQTLRERSDPTG